MDTRIGTYKYPILNNGVGYVSTAYPMRIRIQSTRDTGYAGYGMYPRRLARGSIEAYLNKEARSGAAGHVPAPELTSARRRGSGPQDTWSEATTYIAACGCTHCSLS
jgi:hypothetical protein